MDNLATLTFKDNTESYIINDKTIKSKNSYFNKKIAKLQNVIKNINQGSKLKSFVQIPIQRLVELIEYKAELEGIQIVKINESYTSGCSSIYLEKLNKFNYNKSKRIARGLFKKGNKLTNADVNGSLNIMRKYSKDKCILKMLKQIRDNKVVDTPSRLRVS